MKLNKILFHILTILILGILHLFVLRSSSFFVNLNLILCFIVFFVFLDYRLSLLWSFIGGFILSFYSFYPFGTYIILFLLTSYFAHYLFKKFFPRHSLTSLILFAVLVIFIYHFLFTLINLLFYQIGIISISVRLNNDYFLSLFNSVFLNTLAIVLLTLTYTFLERKK